MRQFCIQLRINALKQMLKLAMLAQECKSKKTTMARMQYDQSTTFACVHTCTCTLLWS